MWSVEISLNMVALRKSGIKIRLIVSVSVLVASELTVMVHYVSCRHVGLLHDVTSICNFFSSNMTTVLQLL
jgi:hypothetical protein